MHAMYKEKQLGLQLLGCRRKWHPVSKRSSGSATGFKNKIPQNVVTGTKKSSDQIPQITLPFAHARLGPFYQDRPVLRNQYLQDTLLISYLRRHISRQHFPVMSADLEHFGERVAGEIYDLSLQMEAEQPRLEQIDAWGKRVDKLVVSPAWNRMKQIAAEECLVASGYERKYDEWSRLYQFAKLYLFEPSGGLYGCPLAMTNGAAKTLEMLQTRFPAIYERAFNHLTSRDPKTFWTSGQWMTEKQGGSDVAGGTETIAVKQPDGYYKLYGYKWFSSATDADVALTLARVVAKDGSVVEGTRGLSLFYLELRDEKGAMNNIQMLKLKNKLGTKQLPTAELLIDGAKAYRISDEGRGVSSMASMLTMTRIHSAVASASAMRRMVNLARDYATRRTAFGKILHRHPLHVHTLAAMEVETRAAAIFVFEIARLLGRQEVLPLDKKLEDEAEVLRLLVPLSKLYISKRSVALVSEGLESFGGQGYIEDTDLPRMLRDTQVNAIWEGTTNILSLDILRAVNRSSGAVLNHFQSDVISRIRNGRDIPNLQEASIRVERALKEVLQFAKQLPQNCVEMAAREFAYSLARIYMGALLIEHACYTRASPADIYAAQRWCERDLSPLCSHGDHNNFTEDAQKQNLDLVFDGYPEKSRL